MNKQNKLEKFKKEQKSNKFFIKSLNSFFDLVRVEHGLMYAFAVIIGALIVGGFDSLSIAVIIGCIVAILIEFGAFSLNDFVDLKADIANKRRDRPLVRGEVSSSAAFIIGIVSFTLANIIAFLYLNEIAFFIILIFSILSLLYDFLLKNLPFIGNFVIALSMAVPFIFGALIVTELSTSIQPVICLSAIAFLVGLGREIMKDIEDVRGDESVGAKTLPVVIGVKNSARLAAIFFISSVVLSFLPMFTFFAGKIPYFLVLVTDVILIDISRKMLNELSLPNLRKWRKTSLIAIGIGLIAFLLATLI